MSMLNCKPSNTLMIPNQKYNHDYDSDSKDVEPTRYYQLVVKLIYITFTQLDISYVVEMASQFMQRPKLCH